MSIFDYWQSCVSRNYSVWLHINEFIYFDRLVFRHRNLGWFHSHFPLSPRSAVLCWFRYIYTNNRWMTPELFFILTHPTYDPTFYFPVNFQNSVNFPFNFLNFHSDALHCHLFQLHIILMHSIAISLRLFSNHWETPPPTALRITHQTATNPVPCPLLQPWYPPPPPSYMYSPHIPQQN